ncbi:hypothetical protein [Rhodococcus sp. OK302]|uniref:hypothetical protein n=1 Tax=Rhodococcus sp. OK302 TaxID=1882769 RepID=UPI000B9440D1|nr:hypothetical protein [Rhodococcus sp. OK302]OYD61141.1 hypothetical protein BDB13_6086 [Rhodococcus sp. OK302]
MYTGLGGGPTAGGGAAMVGGAGSLAFTGFPVAGAAMLMLIVVAAGLLLLRASRVRANELPDMA